MSRIKAFGLCIVLVTLILLVLPVVRPLPPGAVAAAPLLQGADTPPPSPVPTDTPRPPDTDTPRPPDTDTPRPPDTDTPRPPDTDTPRPPDTDTPRPPDTDTPRPPDTDTPRPPDTDTPRPPDTDTPRPVDTDTPQPAQPKPAKDKDEDKERATQPPPPTATYFPTQRNLQVIARRDVEAAALNEEIVYTIRVSAIGGTVRDTRVFFQAPSPVMIADAEMTGGKVESIAGNLLTFYVGSMTAGLEVEFKVKTIVQNTAAPAQFTGKAWATGDSGLTSAAVRDIAVEPVDAGFSVAGAPVSAPPADSRVSASQGANAPIVPATPVSGIIPPVMPVTGGGTIALAAGVVLGAVLALARLLRRK